ncbi:hypothetical protein GCM10029992_59750 [Glycomyces albus]
MLALEDADLVVVERGVVVDVGGVEDEAVVGDDVDAVVLGGGQDLAEGAVVDGGDDEELDALVDHPLDLLDLLLGVVVTVFEDRLVTEVRELLLEGGALDVPAFGGLGGHRDTGEPREFDGFFARRASCQ